MAEGTMGIVVSWIGENPRAAAALMYAGFIGVVLAGLLWPRLPRGRY
jgi:hypothetical protein